MQWTNNLIPNLTSRTINKMKPDIVNLHWVGNGFLPVRGLKKIKPKIFWTLRDMWPFTGGCHYSEKCSRYTIGCGRCPILNSDKPDDLSRRNYFLKFNEWNDVRIHFIAISNWIKEELEKSKIFEDYTIKVIPNGININDFSINNNIKSNGKKFRILFGSVKVDEIRKGYSYFIKALQLLRKEVDKEEIEIHIFGRIDKNSTRDIEFPVHLHGYIKDTKELVKIYESCDIMVVPSLQEAFGKTLIEAMACQTPVVAFNTGGPKDIIDHKIDGYLAQLRSIEDLKNGILYFYDRKEELVEIGKKCRKKVETHYDIKNIAKQYLDYYKSQM